MLPALVPGYWLLLCGLLYAAGFVLVGLLSLETYRDLPAPAKTLWRATLHVLRPVAWPVAIAAVIGLVIFQSVVDYFEMRTAFALEDLKERK